MNDTRVVAQRVVGFWGNNKNGIKKLKEGDVDRKGLKGVFDGY